MAAALCALALLLVGVVLIWAGATQRREGGFFSTAAAQLDTPTTALVTAEVDVAAARPANPAVDIGDLGRVRIRATGTHPGNPIFIGIGPTRQVQDYLRSSAYDEMSSYLTDPLRVTYHRSASSSRPSPPTAQHFWVASVTGIGVQDLQWNKRGGAWSAVTMNANGQPGVTVTADLGLRFGFLLPLGVAVLTVGLLLAAATVTSVPSQRGDGRRALTRSAAAGRGIDSGSVGGRALSDAGLLCCGQGVGASLRQAAC